MGILLAFAPFLAFAIIDRLIGPIEGLFAGAMVSAFLIARDVIKGHTPKILEVGTAVLFAGLTLYATLAKPTWSVIAVRMYVDAGLLIIVLLTMLIGRPFTIQYAREQVDNSVDQTSPEFLHVNYVITGVWALAFAMMVAAEAVLLYLPNASHRLGVLVIVAALVAAVKFTSWYPDHTTKSPGT